jgi:hypothetical protein
MRETRQSGLEGGVRLIPHPYPYRRVHRCGAAANWCSPQFAAPPAVGNERATRPAAKLTGEWEESGESGERDGKDGKGAKGAGLVSIAAGSEVGGLDLVGFGWIGADGAKGEEDADD